ncbi:hypothetical protein ACQFN5_00200 (plasmid) [Klebsiella sp. WOUb02]|uniref:hypothetical protein n=1 Tax=Klebsiella sp. WOUb02 TaxID=3161071 RepID=UPI003D06FEE9
MPDTRADSVCRRREKRLSLRAAVAGVPASPVAGVALTRRTENRHRLWAAP